MEDVLKALYARIEELEKKLAAAKGEMTIPPLNETPEQYYLRMNPDVAANAMYGQEPRKHWETWGHIEGRASKWPKPAAVVPQPPRVEASLPIAHEPTDGLVPTPRGRWFPRPRPDLGEMFMAYTVRVGESQGVKQQAINTQGALFIAATPLFAKHGGFNPDGSNWAAAAEDWLFPIPTAADPGWQQVYGRMGGR